MKTQIKLVHSGTVARVMFETESGIHILSQETRQQLSEILTSLQDDKDCRVVLFEAQGRTFLAGAEITELQKLNVETATEYSQSGQDLMNQIAGLNAVTACFIHAACVGGGCELALACDYRLATASARIGLPEVSLGLIPGWGGTVRAARLLGPTIARRIILSGQLFNAPEALHLGLVDEVFDTKDPTSLLEHFLQNLLTRAPLAVQRAKRAITQLTQRGFKKALRREARHFAACYSTTEPAEGIAAFLEKRRPAWAPVLAVDAAASLPNSPPASGNAASEYVEAGETPGTLTPSSENVQTSKPARRNKKSSNKKNTMGSRAPAAQKPKSEET